MEIGILAVGRMKSGPERDLYDRYTGRIVSVGKSLHVSGPRLIEIPESRLGSAAARKDEESGLLLEKAGVGCRIVMLDETGKDITSTDLSALITQEQEAGTRSLAFAIGGPDGHGTKMREQSIRSLRFGSMTWPHQLARVMLAEQIYRSLMIKSGHPYHRE